MSILWVGVVVNGACVVLTKYPTPKMGARKSLIYRQLGGEQMIEICI